MQSIFSKSLTLMGHGMLAIFVVIFIIFLVLLFLGKSKNKVS
jgi:Na+-transporting methylmalonyl-CoA/oxaloacetate decarboxylase gamma subunit